MAPIAALAFLVLTPLTAIAVDTSQTWAAKRGLQDALDAALLAVARVQPERQSEIDEIARRYVATNLADRYGAVVTALTIRRVEDGHYVGSATANVQTIFASMFGMDTMQAGAEGEVKVNRSKMDVVLSLDTTGSMAGARIDALKVAARDFVKTLLEDNPEAVRIGIVPFARYVNIGMAHRNEPGFTIPADRHWCRMENVPQRKNFRNCVTRTETRTCHNDGVPYTCVNEITDCDYDTEWVDEERCYNDQWLGCVGSRAAPLNMQDDNGGVGIPGVMNTGCGTPLRRLTDDTDDLVDTINGLSIGNETYLPVGLSMGWATLSHRIPFSDGLDPASTPGRDSMRAIVLMTDGMNTVSIQPSHDGMGLHEGNDGAEANTVTADLCRNIKADGVLLFTIAFDVTDGTVRDLLRNCATAPNYAFQADGGPELREAFRGIALALSRLRLTR